MNVDNFMNIMSNQKFGKLTAVKEYGKRCNSLHWLCKCDCGKDSVVRVYHLINGNTKSCGCGHSKYNSAHHSWKGFEEVTGDFMGVMRRNSKKRQNEFQIDAKDVWLKYLEQNKKCYFTGLDINFNDSASVDRIDNDIGYTKTNIRLVHKDINYMRRILTDEKFVFYCQLIAKKFDKRVPS